METITSHSPAETEAAGRKLASLLMERGVPEDNIFVALYGDLGAGKTAFVRGMASVIAPDAPVSSPTFAIMNEYRGGSFTLCHFDMYRIRDDDDLYSVGFYDLSGVIIAAEWCENVPQAIPEHHFRVNIRKPDAENDRIIEIIEVGAE